MSQLHPKRDSTYNLRKQQDCKSKSKVPPKQKKMATSSSAANSSVNAATEKRKASVSDSSSTIDLSGDTSESLLAPDPGSERVLTAMAEMRSMLSGKIDNVLGELTTIKSDLAETKNTVSQLETSVNFAGDRITAIEKDEIPKLKETIKRQEEEIENKLTQMEIHHRKQNLLVYGVPDKRNENIITTVQEILCCFLGITPEEAGKIPLVNAHRLPAPQHGKQLAGRSEPGPSPIIIRFSSMFDRDRLLQAFESQPRRQQRGAAAAAPAPTHQGNRDPAYARVTIRTDLPPALKRERGRLAAVAYRLRRDDKVSTRIKVIGSRVVLQTRKHTPHGLPNNPWTIWSE